MKKMSWKGLLSAFLLIAGILHLTAATLMFIRVKTFKPQNLFLGVAFLIIAIALHRAPTAKQIEGVKPDSSLPLRCPKCGRTYDNSWKVCLKCSVALISNK